MSDETGTTIPRVYVVTRGYRGDYAPIAVFTTRETADAYVSRVNTLKPEYQEPVSVVEDAVPINPRPDMFGAFSVYLKKDGSIFSAQFEDTTDPSTPPEDFTRRPCGVSDNGAWFVGYGRTQEDARAMAEAVRQHSHSQVHA